ncbi:TKL protein kinase [Aphanomyces invadans]|uniref:TKL protein kinase n=1 Tax=Aphanomyces invadans TaxID=157072 RepID=A0A024UBT0_9STRA|nr:TKL protein kinase [Aphanomyces invadans]ETW03846.1 TKL protein kinase [Aphanomyces invadans]|eukprot:XP_008868075.1 TKL protein kinase [Aphanomyces invadans]
MGCVPSAERKRSVRPTEDDFILTNSPHAVILESPQYHLMPQAMPMRFSLFQTIQPQQHTLVDPVDLVHDDLKPIADEFLLDADDFIFIRQLSTAPSRIESSLAQYNCTAVVVRRLASCLTNDDSDLVKEIIAMSRLRHINIVSFIGFYFTCSFRLHCVTEYVEGSSLRQLLDRPKLDLSWDDHKLSMAMYIAQAMAYLHSFKPPTIHRDIKADTVLVTPQLLAKLSGFGAARVRTFDSTMTSTGVGTLKWSAPELLSGDDYDEKVDVYSFGVVLTELDTHETPLASHTVTDTTTLMHALITGKLRPQVAPTCPPRIARLVHACLQHDTAKRPTSDEVVAILADISIAKSEQSPAVT